MELIKRSCAVIIQNQAAISMYTYDMTYLSVCQAITMVPTPIRKIINAVGIVEVDGIKYIPAVAAPVRMTGATSLYHVRKVYFCPI